MDDVGRTSDALRKLDDRAAEERESFGVEIAVAVNVPAPEIFGVVYEVDRRAVHPIAPYGRVFDAAGERHMQVVKDQFASLAADHVSLMAAQSGVARGDDADVAPDARQGSWQSPGHITQPARLGIRRNFG